jgi:hypothetical protein
VEGVAVVDAVGGKTRQRRVGAGIAEAEVGHIAAVIGGGSGEVIVVEEVGEREKSGWREERRVQWLIKERVGIAAGQCREGEAARQRPRWCLRVQLECVVAGERGTEDRHQNRFASGD